jgi:glycosyltransferase involved in cell wall biosynthesis
MPPPFTISVPWDAPVMASANGRHPLPASLIADTPEFRFDRALQPSTPKARAAVERDGFALRDELIALSRGALDATATGSFIDSRDPESQVAMGARGDLLFLHTAPLTLSRRPWVLHIETPLTLFEPYFGPFRTWDLELRRHPAYYMIRYLVRHPNCRGIFTHLMHTLDSLPRLFDDERLADKIHYAPPGLDLDPSAQRLAAAAVERKNARRRNDDFTVLFTNSWGGRGPGFFKRGGAEALMGFLALLPEFPRARLILRTALPESATPALVATLRSHPQVELHENAISDTKLCELLARADVFLLPSASLHTLSLLRAMAFGAVVVTTDVAAVEEFVAHDATGLILPMRHGVTWQYDAALGLLRERGAPLVGTNSELAAGVTGALRSLAEDPARAARLRQAARTRVELAHAITPWRDAFHTMLRTALRAR